MSKNHFSKILTVGEVSYRQIIDTSVKGETVNSLHLDPFLFSKKDKLDSILMEALFFLQEKDKEKGINRKISENEIDDVRRINKYAIHHLIKAFIPSEKLKLIRQGFKKYSDTEKIRHLAESEIIKILKRDRLGKGSSKLEPLFLKFPFVAYIGEYEDVYRIDIKACFYSIYSKVGIDARVKLKKENQNTLIYYTMGKGKIDKENSELVYLLEADKILRNSLYGLTRSCFVNIYYPNKSFQRQFFKAKLFNPELHGLISVLLHSLVSDIKKVTEIVYWNIDGGFLQVKDIGTVEEIVHRYGLSLKIEKAKRVIISRLGGYQWEDEMGNVIQSGHYENAGKLSRSLENLYIIKNREKILENWKKLCLKGK